MLLQPLRRPDARDVRRGSELMGTDSIKWQVSPATSLLAVELGLIYLWAISVDFDCVLLQSLRYLTARNLQSRAQVHDAGYTK